MLRRPFRRRDPRTEFVRSVLPSGGVGAELGVYRGHFAEVLVREASPTRLHLIDPWYLLTPEWSWGKGDRSTVNAVRRILKRWKPEIESGAVVVHVGDDRRVLPAFDDASLDWAYIDSSHAYGHTVEELAILDAKVRPGGLIAGDDWQPDPSHKHHGVYRAVTEFVAARDYEITYADIADHQWAIRRLPNARP
jgi:Methyltransferase domain